MIVKLNNMVQSSFSSDVLQRNKRTYLCWEVTVLSYIGTPLGWLEVWQIPVGVATWIDTGNRTMILSSSVLHPEKVKKKIKNHENKEK